MPGNPKYFSRTVVSSVVGASNYVIKSQNIEGVDTFSGETITLSFYAKADSTKNIAVEFVQNFGTGGSPSASVYAIGAVKKSLTSSWVKQTVTVAIPSISGKTLGSDNNDYLQLNIWLEAGSSFNTRSATLGHQSGTFDIAQVQLELGDTATNFERRSIGEEIQLCQRYAEALTGTAVTGELYKHQRYSVIKRSTPTITLVSGGYGGADIGASLIPEASFRVGVMAAPSIAQDFIVLIDAEL